MAIEIERKYLVTSGAWRAEAADVTLLRQGYLVTGPDCAIRVRVSGSQAWLTIKGKPVKGAALEFEYPVPLEDASAILANLAQRPQIEKNRHRVFRDNLIWEIDEFFGDNAGLILAEVELDDADAVISLPEWIGKEVTGDPRYYNANLVANPYSRWK